MPKSGTLAYIRCTLKAHSSPQTERDRGDTQSNNKQVSAAINAVRNQKTNPRVGFFSPVACCALKKLQPVFLTFTGITLGDWSLGTKRSLM